ncbi:alpha/beta hydrolase domain-containing protein [Candidatus Mycobacterium wuenschmannii]|uniref:Alpha/beta hydrolase domain-containing protein n=1 Tax=Candidatus Mycobacterium wuenschmannii TaxID=3027808 RepID=A0ABY8VWR6_9MYCO|nr:alpha/beta hydrolase domain-containing protein [Candidatus Mycobacterium wuenschmannii]WIM88084.1 alpha/beta hydrolase domain-containing protein [Candidatus Mycobacterium wuenschmannii]
MTQPSSLVVRELTTGTPMTSAHVARICDGYEIDALATGYVEREYLIYGQAHSYTGNAAGPIAVVEAPPCDYVTRIIVRRPRDGEACSGRVLMEPLNTSSGADHDPLWCHVGALLEWCGDTWVGISTHAVSGLRLREHDPARYADIDIATNDFGWDIITHVGNLLRSASKHSPLLEHDITRLYLGGYSQSGTETATYAVAFGAHTTLFDGYFPAARAASLAPISSGNSWILPMEIGPIAPCPAPVLEVIPQTDVEGFIARLTADQDYLNPGGAWVRRNDADTDGDRYRLYEIAGAAHIGAMPGCDGRSDYPLSAMLRACLVRLFDWVEAGVAPPRVPRIVLAEQGQISVASTDEYGNAIGGVRAPHLDVPLACYAVHSTPGILCKLGGDQTLLAVPLLHRRYRDRDSYLAEFTASLDAAVGDGRVLAADRAPLLDHQIALSAAAFGFAASPG